MTYALVILGTITVALALIETRKARGEGAGIVRTLTSAALGPAMFGVALYVGTLLNPGLL